MTKASTIPFNQEGLQKVADSVQVCAEVSQAAIDQLEKRIESLESGAA